MLTDNFQPSALGSKVFNATATSSSGKLPDGGGNSLELNNVAGNETVYLEFGVGSATAIVPTTTVLGSYPVYAGQCKLIRRPMANKGMGPVCDTVAVICESGKSGSIVVSCGEGS